MSTRQTVIQATLIIAATLLAVAHPAAPAAAEAPFPVIGHAAPDFTLTDQHRHPVRLSQFHGKLVLLDFIYTRCPDVCPLTTADLAQVQRELMRRGWWAKDIVFLTVTTDPAYDTPRVLAAYATKYHADPAGWHFLTGKPGTVKQVHAAYGVEVRPASKGLQEHLLPTFVIDRRGVVLGAYGANPNPRDVLHDLEQLR